MYIAASVPSVPKTSSCSLSCGHIPADCRIRRGTTCLLTEHNTTQHGAHQAVLRADAFARRVALHERCVVLRQQLRVLGRVHAAQHEKVDEVPRRIAEAEEVFADKYMVSIRVPAA